MIDLKPYEQEMGVGTCTSWEDAERSLREWREVLQARHPGSVWTSEPEVRTLKGEGFCLFGWYGVFAPLGIVEIPDGVTA